MLSQKNIQGVRNNKSFLINATTGVNNTPLALVWGVVF